MFKFRLQTVLEYRKRKEEDFQKRLALKNRALFEEKKRLDDYIVEKMQYKKELFIKQKGSMIIDDLKMYYIYFDRLKGESEAQHKRIAEVSKEVEMKRSELLSSVKDRKTIEILKEKEYKRYVDNIRKKEQKTIDEIVTTRYKRVG